MKPPAWATWTDGETVSQRVGGRRRDNAQRRRRVEERRRAIAEALEGRLLAAALAPGPPAKLAPAFGASEATIWRDLYAILRPPCEQYFLRDGELLFVVFRDYPGGRILRVEDAQGRERRGERRREIVKTVPRYLGRRR